jgi:hypothetical protein
MIFQLLVKKEWLHNTIHELTASGDTSPETVGASSTSCKSSYYSNTPPQAVACVYYAQLGTNKTNYDTLPQAGTTWNTQTQRQTL